MPKAIQKFKQPSKPVDLFPDVVLARLYRCSTLASRGIYGEYRLVQPVYKIYRAARLQERDGMLLEALSTWVGEELEDLPSALLSLAFQSAPNPRLERQWAKLFERAYRERIQSRDFPRYADIQLEKRKSKATVPAG